MEDNNDNKKYSLSLSFNEITLPPVEDILILGKLSSQGKNGLSKTFDYLVPDTFVVIDVTHENVEAIFVNKRIITKISVEKLIEILEKKVFPYISAQEIIKVDLKVKISYDTIEIE